MTELDMGIIVLYMVGMIVIGFISNKKQQNMEDYYVAGRNAGTMSVTCLWLSSWIGGGAIVGTSGRAYDMGITAIWYVAIIAISLCIFAVTFTKIIKRISDKLASVTYPDFIESRYDSNTRLVATICTILGMTGFVASQFVAGGSILYTLTGWSMKTCFIIVVVVITVYTAVGGLLAITYTDWFQALLLVIGIVIIGVPLCYLHLDGGLDAFRVLPASYFDLGSWGWGHIAALCVSTAFTFFTGMDSYTRCIAAKNEKVARRGALIAAGGIVVIAVAATFLGLASKILLPNLENGSGALAAVIIHLFPSGLRGLIIVGIIAAIMSTADISMLTASANITHDIYFRYINPNASDKKLLAISIMSCLVIGVGAAVFAWYRQDIIDILFIAFTINSAGLFFPTICGVFWKKANSKAAFLSILCSLIAILLWFVGSVFQWAPIFQLDCLWPGVFVSAIIFFPLSYWGKQSKEEEVQIKKFMDSAKDGSQE